MLRSGRVTLSAAFGLLVASVAAGCGEPAEPDHAQVCLEEDTELRVEDEECEDGSTSLERRREWVYIPASHGYPAVGQRAITGTYTTTRPSGGTVSTVKPAGLGGSSYGGGGTAGS